MNWTLTVFAIGMVLILFVIIGAYLVENRLVHNFQITPPPAAR